ncbi:hypothetical protein AC1031_013402 [Aphanomyces cochlioides]|nr:hypothetical protein AC1031_013402 [Aphanomyces cochlioides]
MQRASQMQYFKQTMLPWKDIAITLGRETAESVDTNRMLRGELYQVESLAHALSQWVEKMTNNPVLHSPKDHHFTLQFTSLPETESVRRHGFDWITKHLFHNIDRATHQIHFPSNLSEYLNINAAFTPDTHVITTVNQRVEPVSLDIAAGCLKQQVFNYPGSVEVLDTLDEGMQYLRFKASAADHTFYENTLFREFRQRNRYVIIVHIISEDDKHPQQGARRNWTQWYVSPPSLGRSLCAGLWLMLSMITTHSSESASHGMGCGHRTSICPSRRAHHLDQSSCPILTKRPNCPYIVDYSSRSNIPPSVKTGSNSVSSPSENNLSTCSPNENILLFGSRRPPSLRSRHFSDVS